MIGQESIAEVGDEKSKVGIHISFLKDVITITFTQFGLDKNYTRKETYATSSMIYCRRNCSRFIILGEDRDMKYGIVTQIEEDDYKLVPADVMYLTSARDIRAEVIILIVFVNFIFGGFGGSVIPSASFSVYPDLVKLVPGKGALKPLVVVNEHSFGES